MSGNRKHAITMSILYNCFQLFMFFSTSSLHEGIILSGLLLAAKEIESARSVVKLLPASARFVFHTLMTLCVFFETKTLQFNERVQEVPLPSIQNPIFCPVQALKACCRSRSTRYAFILRAMSRAIVNYLKFSQRELSWGF